MAKKRIPINKKVRFEVLKRDKFTCQYCGRQAPEVVLHVDHIKPIAEGGENEILNLITSCADCNIGKGKKTLSDDSAITKQKKQLDELQERRDQLDMMFKWKTELSEIDNQTALKVVELWTAHTPGYGLNEKGIENFKLWIKKFGLETVIDAIEVAAEKVIIKEDGQADKASIQTALNKIPGIAFIKNSPDKDIYYIRGIMRKRFYYVNEKSAIIILSKLKRNNADMDYILNFTKNCDKWTDWRDEMEDYGRKLEENNGN